MQSIKLCGGEVAQVLLMGTCWWCWVVSGAVDLFKEISRLAHTFCSSSDLCSICICNMKFRGKKTKIMDLPSRVDQSGHFFKNIFFFLVAKMTPLKQYHNSKKSNVFWRKFVENIFSYFQKLSVK